MNFKVLLPVRESHLTHLCAPSSIVQIFIQQASSFKIERPEQLHRYRPWLSYFASFGSTVYLFIPFPTWLQYVGWKELWRWQYLTLCWMLDDGLPICGPYVGNSTTYPNKRHQSRPVLLQLVLMDEYHPCCECFFKRSLKHFPDTGTPHLGCSITSNPPERIEWLQLVFLSIGGFPLLTINEGSFSPDKGTHMLVYVGNRRQHKKRR